MVHSLNKIKKASTLMLVLMVLGCTIFPITNATDGVYAKEYKYSYGGYEWTFKVNIPKNLYDTYKAVPESNRIQYGPAGYGYLTTTKDEYIIAISNELERSAKEKGYSQYETVSLILAFVQSLKYTSDSSSAGYDEYPRFPIETLVDDGGDCEDTSILFATIMVILGYGVIYINPTGHLAVGIYGEDSVQGSYWTYDGKRYYYCETTGDGYGIGELPSDTSSKAYLYDININSQYEPNLNSPSGQEGTQSYDYSGIVIALIVSLAVASIFIVIYFITNKKPKPTSTYNNPNYYQPITPQPTNWYCTQCGTQNTSDANFCKNCGNRKVD